MVDRWQGVFVVSYRGFGCHQMMTAALETWLGFWKTALLESESNFLTEVRPFQRTNLLLRFVITLNYQYNLYVASTIDGFNFKIILS